eukprot:evm.model.scf_3004.1 EVM.evm.TU.scf_3004.1   scf_3004:5115-5573(-)
MSSAIPVSHLAKSWQMYFVQDYRHQPVPLQVRYQPHQLASHKGHPFLFSRHRQCLWLQASLTAPSFHEICLGLKPQVEVLPVLTTAKDPHRPHAQEIALIFVLLKTAWGLRTRRTGELKHHEALLALVCQLSSENVGRLESACLAVHPAAPL